MTWSYKLVNGDFDLSGPNGFSVVTGPQKLIQDLKNWILEPRGTDPFTPDYGSTLDGGLMPDGTYTSSSIGQNATRERFMDIEAELRRVLLAYQNQQLSRLKRESIAYGGKNTFSPGEILYGINSVKVSQIGDVAVASISIQTQSGQSFTFAQPV